MVLRFLIGRYQINWNVKTAYIKDFKGRKFAEFNKNNLHLVGYSVPIKKRLTRKELFKKIYVDKNNY